MTSCPECGANMDLVGRVHNCRPTTLAAWPVQKPSGKHRDISGQKRNGRPAKGGTRRWVRLPDDVWATLDRIVAGGEGDTVDGLIRQAVKETWE